MFFRENSRKLASPVWSKNPLPAKSNFLQILLPRLSNYNTYNVFDPSFILNGIFVKVLLKWGVFAISTQPNYRHKILQILTMRYNIEFRKMTYYGLIISFYQKIEVNL